MFLVLLLFSITLLVMGMFRTRVMKKTWRLLEEKCYSHQLYRVPKFNGDMQENELYRKVHAYLNSLPCLDDSDVATLLSSSSPTEINLVLAEGQTVSDRFLGAGVRWTIETGGENLVMRIRRGDRRRVLVPYLQHIHQAYEEMVQRRREVRLHVDDGEGRWRSVPFAHPATMETVVMDADLKARVRSDLETFLRSGQYYRRLGRVWRRTYLLHGASGTGKSAFAAAMAKLANYDVYEVDLGRVRDGADLRRLLLRTTRRSVLVVEDLDRHLAAVPGVLSFMDGLISCCGEERLVVFTMTGEGSGACGALRPGRVDVHIHFPLCDFAAFRALAGSHLGLKDHKLFQQVEGIFRNGAALSPAEISEIMISNRASPSRALRTVITALQGNIAGRIERGLSGFGSRRTDESDGSCKEGPNGIHPLKEIKNLYGLLSSRSCRKASIDKFDTDPSERENSGSTHSRDN